MKHSLFISTCLTALVLACAAAAFGCGVDPFGGQQRGYVTGKVTDAQGKPLQGVKIIIDHGLFYNTNLTTTTDASGRYKIKIPNGGWYAYAQYKKTFNGKTYSFYLKPDNSDSFGGEGAVRNFIWALTGPKEEPLAPGFFGGTVTFDEYPGGMAFLDDREIEFTLTPVGKLIDGSDGKTLTLRSEDGDRLRDIPIGRYVISATHKGKKLGLRKFRSDDEYVFELEFDFEPSMPDCDNCFAIHYRY